MLWHARLPIPSLLRCQAGSVRDKARAATVGGTAIARRSSRSGRSPDPIDILFPGGDAGPTRADPPARSHSGDKSPAHSRGAAWLNRGLDRVAYLVQGAASVYAV